MSRDRSARDSIKVLQSEGREEWQWAWLRKSSSRALTALLQEPYGKQGGIEYLHKTAYAEKTQIYSNKNVKAVTVKNWQLAVSYVAVRISLYITTIYNEPGANTNRRLRETDRKLGNNNNDRMHLLEGDWNTHSKALRYDQTDRRGEFS